ncbi:hypothetical protein PPTG_11129 [Phytophthora nicotianae INRA-310]|uniref:Ubiquitin-like protease family profile domain-containing protein n=1 Tax=Phytophthora nicotianae (strain INRA-310) TaxID=761204 RepID=W2Q9Y0_PHYN3|nr:hypothetical protein PPTG_11129 [Phytophthora nicotianae INRA-310]ETN09080.1 hypothetical protein PPTG_11129 [Phytophthora nicotianae INRA-310]
MPPCNTDACIVGKLAGLEDIGDYVGDGVAISCDTGEDTGDGVTNSTSVGENTTNSGRDLASDSPMEIKIEKERRSTQASTAITRRKLNLYISDSDSSDQIVNIVLNTASKPAGRPREKASTKKARRRKEFQDTKVLIQQINTYGDTTLSTLREYVDQKKLSLEQIEPLFNAIRPRRDDAVFKRPKGHMVTLRTTKSVETNIRYTLPEQLVLKAQTAGKNAISRGQSEYGRTPPHEDITVLFLDVGLFSLVDIDTMHEWHCLKKNISAVHKLMKWIETKPQTETRCKILKRVQKINVYTSLKSKSGETLVQFDDLTRFAGEMWLSDGCVVVAALKVADAWSRSQNSGRITQVHVVDPVFLGFQDAADRARMLDTSELLLSTVSQSRVILIPVYIVVDISHWCGAIVDFGCKTIWIYDPKHNEEYLNAVTTIMTKKIVPVIDQACKLTIRRSSAWYQDDGHNCGGFIVKWFETYINVAHNTKVAEDLVQLTPDFTSAKDLDDCRYKMFKSVFMDVTS